MTQMARDLVDSPASRFPSEILAVIFALVPRPHHPLYPDSTLGEPSNMICVQDLLPLTEVCRYWKNVVFGTPSLWSSVLDHTADPSRPPLYTHYLHRCTGGPLYVHLTRGLSKLALQLLCQEGPRIRDLYITAPMSLTKVVLPVIEHCEIINTPEEQDITVLRLFHDTSRLRILKLVNSDVIPSDAFPTLTHLHLASRRQSNLLMEDLIGLLSRAPQLRVLEITPHKWISGVSTQGQSFEHVHLGHLELFSYLYLETALRVRGCVRFLQAFCSRVSFPSTCETFIGWLHMNSLWFSVAGLIDHPVRATHLRIGRAEGHSKQSLATFLSFNISSPEHPWKKTIGAEISHRSASFIPSDRDRLRKDVRNMLSTSSAFSALRKLWFAPDIGWLFRASCPFFTGLQALEVLVIRMDVGKYCPRADSVVASLEVSEGKAVGCPLLKLLALDCKHDGDTEWACGVVGRRAKGGYPLSRLILGSWKKDQTYVSEVYEGSVLSPVRIGGVEVMDELWARWNLIDMGL